jgi:hypothetical protein
MVVDGVPVLKQLLKEKEYMWTTLVWFSIRSSGGVL